jgi:hypothetical protein
LATAIALKCDGENLLLTCSHAIRDAETKQVISNLFVAKNVYKEDGKYVADIMIPIELVKDNQELDWAVLKRTDGIPFEHMIPMCDKSEIPKPDNEPQFKIYYYAIRHFQEQGNLPHLNITMSQSAKLLSIGPTHFFMPFGNVEGSSGGAAVDSNGFLVGMHLESVNYVKTLDDASKIRKENSTNKRQKRDTAESIQDRLGDLEVVSNSVSGNYTNESMFLLVPAIDDLITTVIEPMKNYS